MYCDVLTLWSLYDYNTLYTYFYAFQRFGAPSLLTSLQGHDITYIRIYIREDKFFPFSLVSAFW